MIKNKIDRALIIKSITKMVADKEAVRAYIKGKADFKSIKEKGIEFAKPI